MPMLKITIETSLNPDSKMRDTKITTEGFTDMLEIIGVLEIAKHQQIKKSLELGANSPTTKKGRGKKKK